MRRLFAGRLASLGQSVLARHGAALRRRTDAAALRRRLADRRDRKGSGHARAPLRGDSVTRILLGRDGGRPAARRRAAPDCPNGQRGLPPSRSVHCCRRPPRPATVGSSRRELWGSHAHLLVTRCLRRREAGRFGTDRRGRHRRRRVRRHRHDGPDQPAHADLELEAVRRHLRGLHPRRVPRPRRLRVLPERRRQLLRRAHRDRRRAAGAGRVHDQRRPRPTASSRSATPCGRSRPATPVAH